MPIPISQFIPSPTFLFDIHIFVLYLWKKKKKSESHSVTSNALQLHGLHSLCNSPGQNTGVGSLSLLKGIFPIQGSNPGLPHCRRILYHLSHKGSPRILEWVAYPFSSRSSQPRNWTGSPALQADSLLTELSWKPLVWYFCLYFCFVNKIIYTNFLNPQGP